MDSIAARTCFICLDEADATRALLRGCCACRGTAGDAHLECLAQAAARTDGAMWQDCPTCKAMWTGEVALGLARARYAGLGGVEDGDERLEAGLALTQALGRSGELAEAEALGRKVLATQRRV